VFEAPVGRHSQKPEAFYGLVEQLADGPYAELFARRRRENWTCFGNELPTETSAA
jgi:N6-adenosine-specific RNA methylase IME4